MHNCSITNHQVLILTVTIENTFTLQNIYIINGEFL